MDRHSKIRPQANQVPCTKKDICLLPAKQNCLVTAHFPLVCLEQLHAPFESTPASTFDIKKITANKTIRVIVWDLIINISTFGKNIMLFSYNSNFRNLKIKKPKLPIMNFSNFISH